MSCDFRFFYTSVLVVILTVELDFTDHL